MFVQTSVLPKPGTDIVQVRFSRVNIINIRINGLQALLKLEINGSNLGNK